jgi:hypothetical protein
VPHKHLSVALAGVAAEGAAIDAGQCKSPIACLLNDKLVVVRGISACAMAALYKYFASLAVILPAVMGLGAMTMSEIVVSFVRIAAIEQAPASETPRWNSERLKAEADAPYIAKGSLSPIYPAAPGKELLGRPVYTVSTKHINARQPLQLHNFTRPIHLADEQDRNYRQQGLGYAQERPSHLLQRRMPVLFGRGIY